MTKVLHITKLILRMFCLRSLPHEIPYSTKLLGVIGVCFVVLKTLSLIWFIQLINQYYPKNPFQLGVTGAFMLALLWILMLFACVRSVLIYYNLSSRTVQVVTALLAMDVLLVMLQMCWYAMLAVVGLPLASGALSTILIAIVLVLLMYWQFMVYIYIFVHSFDIGMFRAGVFALVYLLMQNYVADLLMNVLVSSSAGA